METLAMDMKPATEPKVFPLERASELAKQLLEEIEGFVDSVVIAGSIRRRRAQVKDIDLVCVADDRMKLYQYLVEKGYKMSTNAHSAEHYWRFIYNGISVDLFWATKETFPMILLIRTGPKHHNIHLINRAKQFGKRISSSIGIYSKSGDLIDTKTEVDIYRELHMVYHRATERDAIGKKDY
ncbi:hypothetical protein HQ531_03450 [bacterium]|nr:hypothetical protein [bacterium]